MALKGAYKSIDDVPEGLQDFVTEKDGEYVLQVEGMVPKANVNEFRDNNIKLQKELEKVQKKLAGVDIEEYTALKQEKQRIADQELVEAGKIDELLAVKTERMRTDFESRVEQIQREAAEAIEKANAYEDQFNTMIVDNQLKDAALKNGVRPEAIADVLARGKQVWRRTDTNEIAAYNGDTPLYGKQGKDLDVSEWFEGLAEQAPHLFKTSSGSGAAGGAGSQGRRISRYDQDSLNANLEAIAEGRVVLGE